MLRFSIYILVNTLASFIHPISRGCWGHKVSMISETQTGSLRVQVVGSVVPASSSDNVAESL